jgi:hypothetical protein
MKKTHEIEELSLCISQESASVTNHCWNDPIEASTGRSSGATASDVDKSCLKPNHDSSNRRSDSRDAELGAMSCSDATQQSGSRCGLTIRGLIALVQTASGSRHGQLRLQPGWCNGTRVTLRSVCVSSTGTVRHF